MNNSPDMWNLKERDYPRFNPDDSVFEDRVIKTTNEFGINFKDKTILDIGCGSGRYSINLARTAGFMTCVDFSENMLRALREDSVKFKVDQKIKTVHSDFLNFYSEISFDIVFASMTPALNNESAFQKADSLAKEAVVFLGWAGKRESVISSEIFAAHGTKFDPPKMAENLKNWLNKKDIFFKSMLFETSWKRYEDLNDSLRHEAWHLKMRGLVPDAEVIKKILLKFMDKEGKIMNETFVKLELIVWEK